MEEEQVREAVVEETTPEAAEQVDPAEPTTTEEKVAQDVEVSPEEDSQKRNELFNAELVLLCEKYGKMLGVSIFDKK